jgi:hypothetical protein
MKPIYLAALYLFSACATPTMDPVLLCQQRIVAASQAEPANQTSDHQDDAWGTGAYRKLDMTSCSDDQEAVVRNLIDAGTKLDALSMADEKAAKSGGEQQAAAFQDFNDMLITYENLQNAEVRKLEKMQGTANN